MLEEPKYQSKTYNYIDVQKTIVMNQTTKMGNIPQKKRAKFLEHSGKKCLLERLYDYFCVSVCLGNLYFKWISWTCWKHLLLQPWEKDKEMTVSWKLKGATYLALNNSTDLNLFVLIQCFWEHSLIVVFRNTKIHPNRKF